MDTAGISAITSQLSAQVGKLTSLVDGGLETEATTVADIKLESPRRARNCHCGATQAVGGAMELAGVGGILSSLQALVSKLSDLIGRLAGSPKGGDEVPPQGDEVPPPGDFEQVDSDTLDGTLKPDASEFSPLVARYRALVNEPIRIDLEQFSDVELEAMAALNGSDGDGSLFERASDALHGVRTGGTEHLVDGLRAIAALPDSDNRDSIIEILDLLLKRQWEIGNVRSEALELQERNGQVNSALAEMHAASTEYVTLMRETLQKDPSEWESSYAELEAARANFAAQTQANGDQLVPTEPGATPIEN